MPASPSLVWNTFTNWFLQVLFRQQANIRRLPVRPFHLLVSGPLVLYSSNQLGPIVCKSSLKPSPHTSLGGASWWLNDGMVLYPTACLFSGCRAIEPDDKGGDVVCNQVALMNSFAALSKHFRWANQAERHAPTSTTSSSLARHPLSFNSRLDMAKKFRSRLNCCCCCCWCRGRKGNKWNSNLIKSPNAGRPRFLI